MSHVLGSLIIFERSDAQRFVISSVIVCGLEIESQRPFHCGTLEVKDISLPDLPARFTDHTPEVT